MHFGREVALPGFWVRVIWVQLCTTGLSGIVGFGSFGRMDYPVDLPYVHLQTTFSFEQTGALVTVESLHCCN